MMPARNINDRIKMKGIYILIISVTRNIQLKIGSLGKMKFSKGMYAYVGSAQNNLEKRIARHNSKNKKSFWHIDYLLRNKSTKIRNVFYKKSGKLEECSIANKLYKIGVLIPDFGCSDCDCKSHLFKVKNRNSISSLGVRKL
jgi:Uri superfamily endonuclease